MYVVSVSVEHILVHYVLSEWVIYFPLISQPHTMHGIYWLCTYIALTNYVYSHTYNTVHEVKK